MRPARVNFEIYQSGFVGIAIAVVITIALGASGLLAYQKFNPVREFFQPQATPPNIPIKSAPSPIPNPSPTLGQDSLMLFTNVNHKYSFKYPQTMFLTDKDNRTDVGFPKDPKCTEFCFKGFYIAAADTDEKILTKEMVEIGKEGFSTYSTEGLTFKETTLGGVRALESVGGVPSAGFDKIEEEILVLKDGKFFQIRYGVDTQTQLKTVKQILSTFRFTE